MLNVEPIVVGTVGLAAMGLGVSQLLASEASLGELKTLVAIAKESPRTTSLPASCGTNASPAGLLDCGRRLHQRGTIETMLGNTLLIAGSVLVATSLVWLLVEGLQRAPIAVTPTVSPHGAALVVQGRF
ncbi:MAG: hypothetical protein SFW67_15585 [Myxococcaceae bacterium]|nr:hypothetical protein [Myxococcaceae bacterium]